MAYRRIPVGAADFIIRISTSGGKEVSSLGDIFFSLLPPYFNLLLLPATSEVILLEGAFTFVGCGKRRVNTKKSTVYETRRADPLYGPSSCETRHYPLVQIGVRSDANKVRNRWRMKATVNLKRVPTKVVTHTC